MKKILVLIVITLLFECRKNTFGKPIDIKKEITELNTISERTEYLEKIYLTDQEIRDGKSSQLILKYGNDSPEVLDFYSKADSTDALNLRRIEFYLKKFGYPSLDSTTT